MKTFLTSLSLLVALNTSGQVVAWDKSKIHQYADGRLYEINEYDSSGNHTLYLELDYDVGDTTALWKYRYNKFNLPESYTGLYEKGSVLYHLDSLKELWTVSSELEGDYKYRKNMNMLNDTLVSIQQGIWEHEIDSSMKQLILTYWAYGRRIGLEQSPIYKVSQRSTIYHYVDSLNGYYRASENSIDLIRRDTAMNVTYSIEYKPNFKYTYFWEITDDTMRYTNLRGKHLRLSAFSSILKSEWSIYTADIEQYK